MAAFDIATGYVEDWAAHDFVESAEYQSPPDIPPERLAACKVKLDDAVGGVGGQGSPLSYDDTVRGAIAWVPSEPTLELMIDGVLILETSGAYIIRAATKSRFGHWQLTVEPNR
ncbi:hypothetical protein [Botrimarina mediterranea]|uniref:hypothetical protein n=1 Tax=Botrimarina mediterranea TaxID=2528022 RepID=UPI00118B1C1E|nr:hypothetical protein K2D_16880 [Planctomycetes bacterium K2D]